MGVALLAGWLGLSAPVRAQFPPAPPGPAGAGYPPPPAGQVPPPGYGVPGSDGPMPGSPGPDWSPPPLNGAPAPAECLPPNGFSNVHPERVGLVPQFSIQADYLLWWFRKMQIPALVTLGSTNDPLPGAAFQPSTVPAIGPSTLGVGEQSGGRLTALYWFDQAHTWGVDASAFMMVDATKQDAVVASGNNGGTAVVARPFFNPNTLMEDADPIAVPGVQSGTLNISTPRRFWGADANVRYSEPLEFVVFSRMTLLAGVRYLDLNEKLLIAENEVDVPDTVGNPGNITTLQDNFETRNRFYGAQVGVEFESRVGPVVVTFLGKVAVGRTQQVVTISGASAVTEPDGTVTFDGTRGLLVQPTNLGRISRNQLGVVPEVGITMAWEFNEYVRVSLGYNFLYWSNIVRPGDQIDTIVNVGAVGDPGQFGTSPHPAVPFKTTGFWAEGLNAGIQVSF